MNAYPAAWLNDGFDWSLPWYASTAQNGGMLDVNGGAGDPEVKGTLIRLLWSDIEATKSTYIYDQLDAALLTGKPLLIRLEVNSACHAPAWAEAAIPYSSTQSFHFWDPKYVNNLTGLINDFANNYKHKSQIVGVHLGIADGEYNNGCPLGGADPFDGSGRDGWGEFWWTAPEEAIYEADGLNDVNFETSVKNIIDLYANAFGSAYAGKLAWMSYDDFGSAKYINKLVSIHSYAQSKGLGNRGGQVEAWMRNTDNVYGVNLVTSQNIDDGSCTMDFDESFADSIQGRYWGEENEFYGDGETDPNLAYINDSTGPTSNQTYRFYVSSMRALQLRRNYFSINAPGHTYLRSANDEFNSGDFIGYLSKTLGRTRSDTPDAFVVLGERPINAGSGLYPTEYKAISQPQESCLQQANAKGYALVSDFGRWLKVVSRTDADPTMKKSMPNLQNNWGQIMSAPRLNEYNPPVLEHFELYARKSDAMYLDINDQLIQERCGGTCGIRVMVVFKDDHVMNLRAVPTNGTASSVVPTFGDGNIRTATFELNDFASGGTLPDFHIETADDSDLSVLMIRVTFDSNQVAVPEIPVGISPNSTASSGDVTFTWKPVSGATEYIVSYGITGIPYVGGSYETADALNCASGTCSQTIPNLPVGSGEWWVRAKNAAGESANWSIGITFSLSNTLIKPTIIGPDNNVTTQGSVTVTWQPTGAPQYRVSHNSYDHAGQYNAGVAKTAAELGCSSGTCSHTIYNLLSGPSEWWVLSKGSAGESAWSDGGEFTVISPATPTVMSPKNSVNTSGSPILVWWPTAGALKYKVDYQNGTAGYQPDSFKLADEFNCSTGQCSRPLYGLEAGASKWWVTAQSSAGDSASTGEYLFTVTPPATPVVISPQNNVNTSSMVTVKWWPTAGALKYKIDYQNGTAGYQPDSFKLADEFSCSTGQCSHTLPNLSAGSSIWWVTAQSTAGTSSSTGGNIFTVVP